MGTLEVCYGCARSKSKECAVRKNKYTRATKPGEMIYVDMIGPFPEILIGNRYWIGVVDDYIRYY